MVGKNLQDHLFIYTAFECTQNITLHYLASPPKLQVGCRWLYDRTGVASNVWEMGGLVNGNANVPHPNLQYHFAPVYSEYKGRRIKLYQGYQLNCDQLVAKSTGTVSLRCPTLLTDPLRTNYLSDRFDLRELAEGFDKMMSYCISLRSPRGARITPTANIPQTVSATGNISSELENWIRQTASTDYHPCGTCKMGADDKQSVVDSEMRGTA